VAREQGRRRLGLSEDDFVFLFIFDFHSHLARKNPFALIDAFKLAFRPGWNIVESISHALRFFRGSLKDSE